MRQYSIPSHQAQSGAGSAADPAEAKEKEQVRKADPSIHNLREVGFDKMGLDFHPAGTLPRDQDYNGNRPQHTTMASRARYGFSSSPIQLN